MHLAIQIILSKKKKLASLNHIELDLSWQSQQNIRALHFIYHFWCCVLLLLITSFLLNKCYREFSLNFQTNFTETNKLTIFTGISKIRFLYSSRLLYCAKFNHRTQLFNSDSFCQCNTCIISLLYAPSSDTNGSWVMGHGLRHRIQSQLIQYSFAKTYL